MEQLGPTPFGIFLLADDYLEAARRAETGGSMRGGGPVRLLAYHSCELYLKAFLRQRGATQSDLRSHRHDVPSLLKECEDGGLKIDGDVRALLTQAAKNGDYVRVRYAVTEEGMTMKPERTIRLALEVREAVRLALNFDERGNPR